MIRNLPHPFEKKGEDAVMRLKHYIPNQHGAWAMLVLPFLFGMAASTPGWIHALLFACWLLIYLLMFPLLQWVRTGKGDRYRKPALLYGTLLVPAGTALALLRPDVILMALLSTTPGKNANAP